MVPTIFNKNITKLIVEKLNSIPLYRSDNEQIKIISDCKYQNIADISIVLSHEKYNNDLPNQYTISLQNKAANTMNSEAEACRIIITVNNIALHCIDIGS